MYIEHASKQFLMYNIQYLNNVLTISVYKPYLRLEWLMDIILGNGKVVMLHTKINVPF